MQADATKWAEDAFKTYSVERDIAAHLKRHFDRNHGLTWHCIVGQKFGIYITRQDNAYIYFSVHGTCILLFKTN